MVHLYTVRHSPRQRIDPISKHIVRKFPLTYQQSMDSGRLFVKCLLHSQMLFALPRYHVYIKRSLCFHISQSHSHSVRIQISDRKNIKRYFCNGIMFSAYQSAFTIDMPLYTLNFIVSTAFFLSVFLTVVSAINEWYRKMLYT